MADRTVVIDDARRELEALLRLVPDLLWLRKYHALNSSWPHLDLRGFLQRYHSIEMGIGRALEAGGIANIGGGELDALDQDALIFGHLSMRIARLLPDPGRLAASIRGYLQKNANLRPFLFELETFDTIQQRGFDVSPTDLLDVAQYDFLASTAGHAVAVECKHISGDAGMAIHKAQALELFDRIANYAARRGISLANTLIDIHIPGRLDDIGSVSVRCSRALAERVNVDDALASIRVRPITPEHLRRLAEAHEADDHDEVRHASINEVLGLAASGHLFVTGGPEEALVFSLSSAAANDPVETIFKRLIADAKRQLPTDLPGVLMIEIADLEGTDEGFFARRPTGDPFGEKTEELFRRRPQVMGVCFTAGARNTGLGHPWIVADRGIVHRPSLIFRNRNHPLYGNEEVAAILGARLG